MRTEKTLPFVRKVWEDSRRMNPLSDILGLSPRDFSIFRLLNSMGAMPASSVAVRLKMNRTTVFSALRRLIEKGLVYEIPRAGGKYFSAVAPREILRQAEERVEEEKRRIPLLSALVEDLSREQGQFGDRPGVSFFEGENGVISLFQKTLSLGTKQEAFLTLEKIPPEILRYLMSEYIAEKKRFGVMSRVLVPAGIRSEKYRQLDEEGNRTTRFVPENTAFETEIILSDSHVALIDFHAPIGVLIESPSIAVTLRSAFDLLWNSAKS